MLIVGIDVGLGILLPERDSRSSVANGDDEGGGQQRPIDEDGSAEAAVGHGVHRRVRTKVQQRKAHRLTARRLLKYFCVGVWGGGREEEEQKL